MLEKQTICTTISHQKCATPCFKWNSVRNRKPRLHHFIWVVHRCSVYFNNVFISLSGVNNNNTGMIMKKQLKKKDRFFFCCSQVSFSIICPGIRLGKIHTKILALRISFSLMEWRKEVEGIRLNKYDGVNLILTWNKIKLNWHKIKQNQNTSNSNGVLLIHKS